MLLSSQFENEKTTPTRGKIRTHLYADEAAVTQAQLNHISFKRTERDRISKQAVTWIREIQRHPRSVLDIQSVLHAYPLSSEQGRALMCLAEALLRIPDAHTAKLLIQDKMQAADWSALRDTWTHSKLVTLASKGLRLADKLVDDTSWTRVLKAASDPSIVRGFRLMMKQMGREFILGRTIDEALKRSKTIPDARFSYDMLGEAARTWSMAAAYKESYVNAIERMGEGKAQPNLAMPERDSISVKLSALHPHYRFARYDEVMERLLPDLVELCLKAKAAGIALTVDAEEVERLDLSLSLFEAVAHTTELSDWGGFGFAVQAYQKRSLQIIEWADDLARYTKTPLMIRLVKGAYWDTEIKRAQEEGLPDYPVFTRKAATDISYLACAKRLLAAQGPLHPQFATHNVHTIAAIQQMAKGRDHLEFQRLQGMGEDIYTVVNKDLQHPIRVYAPVGDHQNLLAYLVRRLLENGANSSFIHKIYDKSQSLDDILTDPFVFFEKSPPGSHPDIPSPAQIYGPARLNSQGFDLADPLALKRIQTQIQKASLPPPSQDGTVSISTNPAHSEEVLGALLEATPHDLDQMLDHAQKAQAAWDERGAEARAQILETAATLLEEQRGLFLKLLIQEGGKVLEDARDEVREAVDFCRYYANEARRLYGPPQTLPGPTGELNQLQLRGRGVFACISPWNFPLAIFMGQVTAALAAGNSVIAKPASQTPLVAQAAFQLLHQAGVPQEALHLLVGPGRTLGTALVEDHRTNGIVFTGSTDTAQSLQLMLAQRGGPIVPFIAETGGLNAMIVDGSALIEEVVDDVIKSAFHSAGQRCSALRVLFVPDTIYAPLMEMLCQATTELSVGNPQSLATDIGPVIDASARDEIEDYVAKLQDRVKARAPLPEECQQGSYVAPTILEIQNMGEVTREVFGPVLHVLKYKAKDLEQALKDVNAAGYGLTFGLQTRIGSNADLVRQQLKAGNTYINRSTIGAVVGVQPFGGEGLSGTGPKAGGPLYLTRFGVERTWTDNITASGGNVDLLNLRS